MILVFDEDIIAASKLNAQQKYAYDLILEKVFASETTTFFLSMVLEELVKHIYTVLFLLLLDLKN